MVVKSAETKLYYKSRPGRLRPALLPTIFFLLVIWTFSIILLTTTAAALFAGSSQGTTLWMVVAVSAVLICYLILFTKRYIDDFARNYEFELLDKEVRLRIDDRVSGRRFFAHMPYSEMSFVEYYTPRDNASIVFHGLDERIIEVPIWSMTEDTSAIFEVLNNKAVRIVQL